MSDLSGFTMKFGLLYKFGKEGRFGMTFKTPSWITVKETFSSVGTSRFDNGDQYQYPAGVVGSQYNEYDVKTPSIFTGGVAIDVTPLLLALDVDYTDWTQMEFNVSGGADVLFTHYLEDLNTDIKKTFNPTANIRAGVEAAVLDGALNLRGGFMYLPSPYKMDSSPNNQKYATGGIGFTIERTLLIDIGFAHGWWETSHLNYQHYDSGGNPTSQTKEAVTTNNIIATVTYRF